MPGLSAPPQNTSTILLLRDFRVEKLGQLVCRYTKSPEAVQLMGQIKKVFDSNGILNPYKVLPQDGVSRGDHHANAMAA